ncbi:BTAD domain-containing putative transcriptional regulator [Nonomuraea sp. NPDC049158]|uniref:AfsR/SARP family transcriptional regulator n=1 Tax=Nonomuraea sp. NPDC049158 TaxID=3155649 RepID=UPI0033F35E83
MRFRILGPLEAERGGEQLHLGGGLQRVAMAIMLLDANRVVPVTRMIEAVWGEAPPETARNQIQIRISHLRRLLGDTAQPHNLLITMPPGYLLRIGRGQLDLTDFDELTEQAQLEKPAQAARTLRSALALWRGPVLSNVSSDLIQTIAHGVQERRLLAHEQCIDLELKQGRHQQLVAELRGLVQDNPLREQLHGLLMLALYRSGRQAEALDVFHAYRVMLQDTLGLVPGDELRRLELAILNQDAELDSGPAVVRQTPVPRQLPPMISRLSGRDAETRRIGSLLDANGAGTGLPIAAIVGRAGVGKTELALQTAHRLSPGYPDGQLYIDLRGGELQPTDVLSQFLRALGVSSIPRLLEERGALFRSTVAGSRMLLLLDNAGSFEQIWHLLPGGAPCAVLITGRHHLTGLPEHRVVRLDVLDGEGAVELLTHDIGAHRAALEPASIRTLAEQCGGLPLALRIAGARLAVRPQWSVQTLVDMLGDSRTMLDVLSHGDLEVRASLDVSYRGLSSKAQTLFRRLGLLDSPQSTHWLGEALLGDNAAEGAFDELVDASLLVRRGRRYIMHDLVRAYAGESALASDSEEQRQAAVERACKRFLFLADRAHQRYYGGHFTLLRGKNTGDSRDDALADALFGNDPLGWLDEERTTLLATVRQAAAHNLDELCWNIAMTAITLFEIHGYYDEWRAVSEIALESCRSAANTRGEGAMLYSLSTLANFQQRYGEAQPLLLQAIDIFEQIGEVHGMALALRNLALSERVRGELDAALDRYRQALPLLEAVGDRAAEGHVLVSIAAIHLEEDRLDEAEPLLDRALAIFRGDAVQRGEAQALNRIAELSLLRGDAQRALEAFEGALAIVRSVRDRIGETYVLHGTGEAQAALGRPEQAERALSRALDMAQELGERHIEGRTRLSLGLLLSRQGDPRGLTHLRQAHALFADMGAERWRAKAAEALAIVSPG